MYGVGRLLVSGANWLRRLVERSAVFGFVRYVIKAARDGFVWRCAVQVVELVSGGSSRQRADEVIES